MIVTFIIYIYTILFFQFLDICQCLNDTNYFSSNQQSLPYCRIGRKPIQTVLSKDIQTLPLETLTFAVSMETGITFTQAFLGSIGY